MIAVFALSRKGAALSRKISESYPGCKLYLPSKCRDEFPEAIELSRPLSKVVEACWQEYTAFVFIMAAGIVVRTIAPLVENKAKDPGVLVIDEDGRYVISLLSGHLGGANRLAGCLASSLGAEPVITTATDLAGIPALDEIAGKYKFSLENLKDWKKIASAIMDGERAALYSSVPFSPVFPGNVTVFASEPPDGSEFHGIMYITEKIPAEPPDPGTPYVVLRPKNLIIGLGCRRGKLGTDILRAVQDVFARVGLSMKCAAALATIDIKRNESGILETAEVLGVPLRFYSQAELSAYRGKYEESEFVKTKVGTGAVAEPAACLAAEKPCVLVKKTVYDGITVAVVKDLAVEIH